MKTLASLLLLLVLSACAVGPDGKKHYIGPKIRGAITYRGIGVELTLFDPFNPDDPRRIDVTPAAPSSGKEPVTQPGATAAP